MQVRANGPCGSLRERIASFGIVMPVWALMGLCSSGTFWFVLPACKSVKTDLARACGSPWEVLAMQCRLGRWWPCWACVVPALTFLRTFSLSNSRNEHVRYRLTTKHPYADPTQPQQLHCILSCSSETHICKLCLWSRQTIEYKNNRCLKSAKLSV